MTSMNAAADYAEARDVAARHTTTADETKSRHAYRDAQVAHLRAALAAGDAGMAHAVSRGHDEEAARLGAAADALMFHAKAPKTNRARR